MGRVYGTASLDSLSKGCTSEKHWLEIELFDQADKPVAYEKYEIGLSGMPAAKGRLDDHGWIRIERITEGDPCEIVFPELDSRVWEFTASLGPRGAPGSVVGTPRSKQWFTHAGGTITVDEGQCCTSIAGAEGHLPQTIWNAPQNKELRSNRDDPNCLKPGDTLFIPVLERRVDKRSPDQRHRFRLMIAAKLVIVIKYPHGEVRSDTRYEITVDGEMTSSRTSPDGKIEIGIPTGAEKGLLKVFGDSVVGDQVFELRLGTLRPRNETSGVQQRFHNLGSRSIVLDHAQSSVRSDELTIEAVKGYQRSSGSPVTGVAADVADRVASEHGC